MARSPRCLRPTSHVPALAPLHPTSCSKGKRRQADPNLHPNPPPDPQASNAKQDAKRKLEGLEPGPGGVGVKVVGGAGTVIDAVASNTIGRAAKLAQDKLLGAMVDEALEGSFQETVVTAAWITRPHELRHLMYRTRPTSAFQLRLRCPHALAPHRRQTTKGKKGPSKNILPSGGLSGAVKAENAQLADDLQKRVEQLAETSNQ